MRSVNDAERSSSIDAIIVAMRCDDRSIRADSMMKARLIEVLRKKKSALIRPSQHVVERCSGR